MTSKHVSFIMCNCAGPLLKTDPCLALKMYFGPMTPFHMRVMGHGAWPGAKQAIMTTWDRVVTPFNSRKLQEQHQSVIKLLLLYTVAIAILAWFISWLF